jgi:hypothetical protein
MENLYQYSGYFNLIIGALFLLIGFKIFKPYKGESGEVKFNKLKTFYKVGGFLLIVLGLMKIS